MKLTVIHAAIEWAKQHEERTFRLEVNNKILSAYIARYRGIADNAVITLKDSGGINFDEMLDAKQKQQRREIYERLHEEFGGAA